MKKIIEILWILYKFYLIFGVWIFLTCEVSGWFFITVLPAIPCFIFEYQLEYWLRDGEDNQ